MRRSYILKRNKNNEMYQKDIHVAYLIFIGRIYETLNKV